MLHEVESLLGEKLIRKSQRTPLERLGLRLDDWHVILLLKKYERGDDMRAIVTNILDMLSLL
jgi:hypothetical protein